MFLKTKKHIDKNKGFSLIELLVVIALITVLLSTSLFGYDDFGKEIELENAVYSLALAIRETQVFGINKKSRSGLADPQDFGVSYGYGIHFRKTLLPVSTNLDNKHFALFIDDDDNGRLDGECSIGSECYSVISLEKGNYISNIDTIDDSGTLVPKDFINISFKRPNPDAIISTNSDDTYSRVRITIKNGNEETGKCVEVGVTGDITIKNTGC